MQLRAAIPNGKRRQEAMSFDRALAISILLAEFELEQAGISGEWRNELAQVIGFLRKFKETFCGPNRTRSLEDILSKNGGNMNEQQFLEFLHSLDTAAFKALEYQVEQEAIARQGRQARQILAEQSRQGAAVEAELARRRSELKRVNEEQQARIEAERKAQATRADNWERDFLGTTRRNIQEQYDAAVQAQARKSRPPIVSAATLEQQRVARQTTVVEALQNLEQAILQKEVHE